MPPLLVVELDLQVVLNLGHAAELVEEIHVPGAAAVFAVGDALQAQSSCSLTASRMASSSAAREAAGVEASRRVILTRAFSSAGGRSRLPTWSARNGGLDRADMRFR